jgi:hypothetical protein
MHGNIMPTMMIIVPMHIRPYADTLLAHYADCENRHSQHKDAVSDGFFSSVCSLPIDKISNKSYAKV